MRARLQALRQALPDMANNAMLIAYFLAVLAVIAEGIYVTRDAFGGPAFGLDYLFMGVLLVLAMTFVGVFVMTFIGVLVFQLAFVLWRKPAAATNEAAP